MPLKHLIAKKEMNDSEAEGENELRVNDDQQLPEVSSEMQTDDEDEDYEDEKRGVNGKEVSAIKSKSAGKNKNKQTFIAKSNQLRSSKSLSSIGSVSSSSSSRLVRQCVNCGTHSTSQWRTNGNGHYLCNACGLYRKYNGEDRPPANATLQRKRNCHVPKKCSNCGTFTSSMWRRTPNKQTACNACGLYLKLYGVSRPIEMRKDTIYTRNRYSKLVSMLPVDEQLEEHEEHKGENEDEATFRDILCNNKNIKPKQRSKGKRAVKVNKLKESTLTTSNTTISANSSVPPPLACMESKPLLSANVDHHLDSLLPTCAINLSISKESPSQYEEEMLTTTALPQSSCDETTEHEHEHNNIEHEMHEDLHLANRECANCGTKSTSQWRRLSGHFGHYLCNACGLFKISHPGEDRPLDNMHNRKTHRDVQCANCGVCKSSEWRRNKQGQTVCNACGLYYRLHSINRPISMRRDFISHRNRNSLSNSNQTILTQAQSSDPNIQPLNCSDQSKVKNEKQEFAMMGNMLGSASSSKRKQSNPKKVIIDSNQLID